MQARVEAFQVLPVESGPEGGPGPRGGLLGRGRVLALRVRDGSMADEGIREGDYLLVQASGAVAAGQTVVAEVDGAYTVKRLVRQSRGRVFLRSAGPDAASLDLPAGQVRIIGAVVGVFRRQGFRMAGSRVTPPATAEGHTLDLALHTIGQTLRAAEASVAERCGPAVVRLRELTRSLRALRDCYLETSTPRLREALLREAADVMAALRRFGVEPRASSA